MSRSDLLEVIYRHYPRGLYVDDPGYRATEEHRRLAEAARRAVTEYPQWKAMLERLRGKYRLQDESLHVLAGNLDAAYSGHVEIPGRRLGFHVSILGPFFGIHRTGHAEEVAAAKDLVTEIVKTYAGYEEIPVDLGEEIVPDVALGMRGLGEATINDCLLSVFWKRSSGPLP